MELTVTLFKSCHKEQKLPDKKLKTNTTILFHPPIHIIGENLSPLLGKCKGVITNTAIVTYSKLREH